jgi:hypothetical protein
MWEAVGAGNHKTAMAMFRAADALWDARGGHDPTVAVVMIQRAVEAQLVLSYNRIIKPPQIDEQLCGGVYFGLG